MMTRNYLFFVLGILIVSFTGLVFAYENPTTGIGHNYNEIQPCAGEGQVLKIVGGMWTCSDVGTGGGGQWLNAAGGNIYYGNGITGRVGIGTNSPGYGLHVNGTSYSGELVVERSGVTGSKKFLINPNYMNGSVFAYVGTYAGEGMDLALVANGHYGMYINGTSGNVGIGTSNPGAWQLNVYGSTIINGNAEVTERLGIDTNTPEQKFDVTGGSSIFTDYIYLRDYTSNVYDRTLNQGSSVASVDGNWQFDQGAVIVGRFPSGWITGVNRTGQLYVADIATFQNDINALQNVVISHNLIFQPDAVNRAPIISLNTTYGGGRVWQIMAGDSDSGNFRINDNTNTGHPVDRIVIDKDGNVGINPMSTVPGATLDVFGTLRARDDATFAKDVIVSQNVIADGRVGIGIDNPRYLLHIYGVSPTMVLQPNGPSQSPVIILNTTLGNGRIWDIMAGTAGAGNFRIVDDSGGQNKNRLTIDENGVVTMSGLSGSGTVRVCVDNTGKLCRNGDTGCLC